MEKSLKPWLMPPRKSPHDVWEMGLPRLIAK
jgi:hypothetical protein